MKAKSEFRFQAFRLHPLDCAPALRPCSIAYT